MKRVAILAVMMISTGCASNSRVDMLADQVKAQKIQITALQEQQERDYDNQIPLYNRIAGIEGKLENHQLRLNNLSNEVESLMKKFDTKFRHNQMK